MSHGRPCLQLPQQPSLDIAPDQALARQVLILHGMARSVHGCYYEANLTVELRPYRTECPKAFGKGVGTYSASAQRHRKATITAACVLCGYSQYAHKGHFGLAAGSDRIACSGSKPSCPSVGVSLPLEYPFRWYTSWQSQR